MKKMVYSCFTVLATFANSMEYDVIDIHSVNFNDRGATPVKALVTHCVGLDLQSTLKGFAFKAGENDGLGVSPHYFIPQITGQEFLKEFAPVFNLNPELKHPSRVPVIRFVDEKARAWHAGVSAWRDLNSLPGCEKGINSCSIGIEFHAPGYGNQGQDWFHFTNFTAPQINTGAHLMKDIVARHNIERQNIVCHSDIAPWSPVQIKTDPGHLFPWTFLTQAYGIGLYPPKLAEEPDYKPLVVDNPYLYAKEKLVHIGYKMSPGTEWSELDKYALNAFCMHYMQDSYTLILPSDVKFGQPTPEVLSRLADFE